MASAAREEEETARLGEHMLCEILARLPSKGLARCTCVCRGWRDLVSSRGFAALRAERSAAAAAAALGMLSVTADGQGGRLGYVPFDDDDGAEAPDTTLGLSADRRISVKAACNGLVLVELPEVHAYALCNPTTRSVRHVPRPSRRRRGTRFGLAFDPAARPPAPKLVGCSPAVRHEADGAFFQFDVYSPGADAWAVLDSPLPCRADCRLSDTVCSVFFARSLHWLVEEEGGLVAFDVDTHRCYGVALPEGVRATQVAGYPSLWFGLVRGRMTLVRFHDMSIHVWEMEDYSRGKWRFKACVGTPGCAARCYESNVPVHYDGERCVLLSWYRGAVARRECGLAVYRIGAGRWDKFRSLQGFMDSRRHFFPYISYMGGA